MSTANGQTKAESNSALGYLLLFRGKDWDLGRSQEEVGHLVNRFLAWSDGLAKAGILKGGQALARTGITVSGRGGKKVSDGPFAESKEAIGGYLALDVASMDEAVAIAQTYPGCDCDIVVEIRPIIEGCPSMNRYFAEEKRLAALA